MNMKSYLGLSVLVLACAGSWWGCSGDETSGPPVPPTGGSGGTGAVGGGGSGGAVGGTGGVVGGSGGDAGSGGTPCFDNDQDGVTDCEGDCDDDDPTSYPGATEICGDGADNDCDGTADPQALCQGIGTWVSQLTGDDINGDGTQQNPVQTIGQGMQNAQTIGNGVDVYVAEGSYDEDITFVEGIDLYGGYQCDGNQCTWARDTAGYDSVINNQDPNGILFPDTITRATRLDGFRVMGVDNPGGVNRVAALTIEGAPTVYDNRIFGGSASGNQTVGIFIVAPTPDPLGGLIEDNLIQGGDAADTTHAILMDTYSWPTPAPGTIAEIAGNTIKGGNGRNSYGITSWSSAVGTLVVDNDIFAGNGGANNNGNAWGVFVGATMVIDANRINADPGQVGFCANNNHRWCGGIFSLSATLDITNNVVFGMNAERSCAVYLTELEMAAGQVILSSNTLDGGGAPNAIGVSDSAAITLWSNYAQSVNVQVGRIRNNILQGGSATHRYGIYEDDMPQPKTCRPELVENNDFYFSPQVSSTDNAYRRWLGSGQPQLEPTVADVDNLGYAQQNFSDDPLLDPTFHLQPGSPCIDAGTATEAPSTDMDGEARPQGGGHDVGADEAG